MFSRIWQLIFAGPGERLYRAQADVERGNLLRRFRCQ